ncbi:MAG: ATP-binding cassette domain-containing protein, partial [Leptotrichiaceae bacterium]|nr:ATP-binding cassette domain-containing protein [Leptotrichiaceae bacterium]
NKEYKNIENNKLIDLMNKSNKNGDNIKIKLDNVSYTYKENGKKIINNLSVCIPKGEITAIIGKTGSGKTTLIELIYGLLDFDEYFDGDMIFYFGNKKIIINKNITLEKEIIKIREKMAIVFQNMESQFFESSVYKEIEYNISKKYNFIKNSFQVSNKIKKVLEKVGLSEKYMSKSPFLLSDGEKRLVGIAMALSTEPEILFLDEPTTSLDYEMIKKIMELIKELKKEKMTIILVTHDLNIVNNYADNYIKL